MKKHGNQVSITTVMPPELLKRLKQLSARTRVPMAAYAREAIEDLLKKYKEKA